MKRLFILLFIIAGCSEDEPAKQVVTYDNLSGNWSFSSGVLSGQFTITDNTKVTGGTFTINGKPYNAENDTEFTVGNLVEGIMLSSDDGFIRFSHGDHNEAFTEITVTSTTYAENCLTTSCPHISYSETITVSRD
ncbi:MAG TPA: hypothetical protein VD927_06285 [Chryseosolibacter sp.]|nr:hypothetical protein [Chryseosolibacter sp.]